MSMKDIMSKAKSMRQAKLKSYGAKGDMPSRSEEMQCGGRTKRAFGGRIQKQAGGAAPRQEVPRPIQHDHQHHACKAGCWCRCAAASSASAAHGCTATPAYGWAAAPNGRASHGHATPSDGRAAPDGHAAAAAV